MSDEQGDERRKGRVEMMKGRRTGRRESQAAKQFV